MVCGCTMFEQWITLCSYKMVVLLTLSLASLQLQAGHHHTEKKQLSASHCFGHTEVHIVFSGHINIYTSGSQFFLLRVESAPKHSFDMSVSCKNRHI